MEERRTKRGEVRDNRRNKRNEERKKEKEGGAGSKKKGGLAGIKGAGGEGKKDFTVKGGKVRVSQAVFTHPRRLPGWREIGPLTYLQLFFFLQTALIVDPISNLLPTSSSNTSTKIPSVPTTSLTFPSLALPSTSLPHSSSHKLPSNPTQALASLQSKQQKLSEMPEEKRKGIEEKEKWKKALERAEGGKVRDDEGRLKKAAKRVEKQKGKSAKEW